MFIKLKSGLYFFGEGGVVAAEPIDIRYAQAGAVYKSSLTFASGTKTVKVEESVDDIYRAMSPPPEPSTSSSDNDSSSSGGYGGLGLGY